MGTLTLIVLTLGLSLGINLLLRRLDISTIVGYIFTGFIVTTFLNQARIDTHNLAELAEFGVVFLMFTIGLEFSLPYMKSMKREVFIFGSLQVLLSSLLFTFIAIYLFGFDTKTSMVIGMALSLSSTAIVLTALNSNGDIHRPYGRYALGILLFQDLAVIPIFLMISFFTQPSETLLFMVSQTLLSGFAVIFILFVLGKYATNNFLRFVVDSKKEEIFVLAILFIVLFSAFITYSFGFSYSLGAFTAGMLIAESKYKYQIEADLVPFRDILIGLFFITVGMQINFGVVAENILLILGLTVAILLIKAVIIFAITVFFSFPKRALKTAFALAQVGEFSFAVLALAKSYDLIENEVLAILIAVIVISLIFTSLTIKHVRFFSNLFFEKPSEVRSDPIYSSGFSNHIIVCGYSGLGQKVVERLRKQNILYVVIEHDRNLVNLGLERGESVFFGNASSRILLNAMNIERALSVIIAIDNDEKIRLICESIYMINPRIDIIVEISHQDQIEALQDLPIKTFVNTKKIIAEALVASAIKCDIVS